MLKKWYSFLTWYGLQAVLVLLAACFIIATLSPKGRTPVNAQCRSYCEDYIVSAEKAHCASACDSLLGPEDDAVKFATCHVICQSFDVECIAKCIEEENQW